MTFTLPAAAAVGDTVEIIGFGAGGWKMAQNANQVIHSTANTTIGIGGSIASQNRYDCVTLECVVANNEWVVTSQRGALTFV